MAKQQDLPLNASEVSGLCGRLLCCLSYENDFYTEARKQMPRINSVLMTPEGAGKVKQVHVLASSVTVQVEGPNETRLMVEVPVPEPVFGERVPESANDGLEAEGEDLTEVEAEGGELPPDDLPTIGRTDAGVTPTSVRPEGSARRSRRRPRRQGS
jgi:hypothetical protein